MVEGDKYFFIRSPFDHAPSGSHQSCKIEISSDSLNTKLDYARTAFLKASPFQETRYNLLTTNCQRYVRVAYEILTTTSIEQEETPTLIVLCATTAAIAVIAVIAGFLKSDKASPFQETRYNLLTTNCQRYVRVAYEILTTTSIEQEETPTLIVVCATTAAIAVIAVIAGFLKSDRKLLLALFAMILLFFLSIFFQEKEKSDFASQVSEFKEKNPLSSRNIVSCDF